MEQDPWGEPEIELRIGAPQFCGVELGSVDIGNLVPHWWNDDQPLLTCSRLGHEGQRLGALRLLLLQQWDQHVLS